jgi:DNA invertase Pin-like site-specific DNA recombinase
MISTVIPSPAQFERALISEQVEAGMTYARAQGERIPRTPIPEHVRIRAVDLDLQGNSIQQIGRLPGIGHGTAWNDVQRIT